MKRKIVELLKNNAVEIIIRTHIPYKCIGLTEDYSVTDKISIGDGCITGYNGITKENISQELMTEIKRAIIFTIENHKKKI